MTVTKVDLLDAKFSKSLFGYRPSEVESALTEAADSLGRAAEENRRLAEKIRDMEKTMESLESREAALRQTLGATQKIVEDLKENARQEARLMLEQAKAKAAGVIREAHERVAEVSREAMEIKRRRLEFEMGFRTLLESHLRYLDLSESDQELDQDRACLGQTLSLGAAGESAEQVKPGEPGEPGEPTEPVESVESGEPTEPAAFDGEPGKRA